MTDLSKLSDAELVSLAKAEGIVPKEYGVDKKAVAFGIGAAEAANPLDIPRSVETIGRGLLGSISSSVPKETPSGLIVPQPTKSFGQAMDEAEQKTVMPNLSVKGLLSKIPAAKDYVSDLPPEYEAAGGLSALAVGGIKGIRGLIKGSPVKQAVNAERSLVKDVKYLTGEAEGPVMDAILTRPREVAALIRNGELSVFDLAKSVSARLIKKEKELGAAVGEFRNAVKSDNVRKIKTDQFKNMAIKAEAEASLTPEIVQGKKTVQSPILDEAGRPISKEVATTTSVGGGSLFSGKDQTKINEIMEMLKPSQLSPRDAMLVIDKIDEMTDYEKQVARGNISEAAAVALGRIRTQLKDALRKTTKESEAWAAADDQFSTFKENSRGLIDKFSGDAAASSVDGLLNKNKDPIRERLAKALNAGPAEGVDSEKFFIELADKKAAQVLKALDVTKADPIKDQLNRLFQKWMRRGEWGGAAVGSYVGGGPTGMAAGGLLGHVVMEPVARSLASPFRLLDRAQKVKTLSKDAKDFAMDLGWLQKNLGTEGANAFMRSLEGGIPAINELAAWVRGNQ